MSPPVTRRALLVLSARLGGGLVLAIEGCAARRPGEARLDQLGPGGRPPAGFRPSAWLEIVPDDSIIFRCDKAEMGQGPTTALAMLLAEELSVAPERITVVFAPADRAYVNPALGLQVTGGSSSVRTMFRPLREAGAAARETLRAAAAAHWGLPLAQCQARDGHVHGAGRAKALSYGALADAAARRPLAAPVLTDRAQFRVIGKSQRRLDALAKVTGAAVFGIDVHVPDALVAVVLRAPRPGATLKSFDAAAALALPGIVKAVAISSGLALVGRSYWRLRKARELVRIQWEGGDAELSSAGLAKAMAAAAASGDGKEVRKTGDADERLAKAHKRQTSVYALPYLAHATMEPQNCTAHVTDDHCTVWAPTQSAGLAQQMAHEVTGLAYDQITINSTFLGGGFGRRLAQDYVREAVEVAQALGQPVKVMWSREDDMRYSLYRPATYHELSGAVDADGKLAAWRHVLVGQSILSGVAPQWVPALMPQWVPDPLKSAGRGVTGALLPWLGDDDTATEGARDMPYIAPNVLVRYRMIGGGLPVGFWRSVGHSYTGFVVESFVDELAHLAGEDPLAFRLAHLAKDAPERRVLTAVADAAGWERPAPAGVFRGLAVHSSFGSCAAQVAEIEREASGAWRVRRVVVGIDCGLVVNPDQVKAQLESAVIYGLSAALYGSITVKAGEVQQGSFDDYPVLRLDACPRIETLLIVSDADPQGVGEPGLPPTAPAVGNALFRATGVRQRSLPLSLAKA